MSHVQPFPNVDPASPEPLTFAQRQVLESAVAKLVLIGEQVGVSPDQMILLLQSGFSVRELLDYVAARSVDNA